MTMTSNRTVLQALLFCSSGPNPHGSFLQSSSTVWLSATACVHVPKWRAASKPLSIHPPIHHVSFALPPPSIPTPISPAGRISAGQPRSSARCPRNSDMQFTWWNKCSQAHGAGPWPVRSARFQKHGPYPAQGRGSITTRYLDNQRTHSAAFMKCVAADRKRKEGIYHQRSQSPATCLHSSGASLLNTELFCLLKIPMLSKTGFYYLVHFNIIHLFWLSL